MHNKTVQAILWFLFGCVASIVLLLCVGCQSNKQPTSRLILEYQQQIDRLEEELRNRDRTVEDAIRELAAITSRSSEMEGTIDDVIELFNEYQRAVERLLRYYSETAATTDNKE